eukprot:6183865-Pleurochrysis_carterae.AAC.3
MARARPFLLNAATHSHLRHATRLGCALATGERGARVRPRGKLCESVRDAARRVDGMRKMW